MSFLSNIIFAIVLIVGVGFFIKNVKKIIRNIKLGQNINRSENTTLMKTAITTIITYDINLFYKPFIEFCVSIFNTNGS
jgi:small-conductance mechanosensitive channel